MDLEDFDDDASLTPAQLIAKQKQAFGGDSDLNSAWRGGANPTRPARRDDDFRIPAAGNTAGRANFGPGGALADPGKLAGELQQLDLGGGRPGVEDFGLEAETAPVTRSALPPPGGRGGGLQPLGGPGALRPGPSPLRPLPAPLQPPAPPVGAGAFGLAAETAQAAASGVLPPPPGPALGPPQLTPLLPPGPPPPGPLTQAELAGGFGLAAEVPPDLTGAPPLGYGAAPAPYGAAPPALPPPLQPNYGLDSEVQAAAAGGVLGAAAQQQQQQQQYQQQLQQQQQQQQQYQQQLLQEQQQQQQYQQQLLQEQQQQQQFQQQQQHLQQQQQQLQQQQQQQQRYQQQLQQQQQYQQQAGPQLQPPPPGQFGLDAEVTAAAPQLLTQHMDPAADPYMQAAMLQAQQGGMPHGQQHSPAWNQPFADTFSLEQLPPDQRWLHLQARQAERIITQLYAQGTQPKVVDIKDVREKLLDSTCPPRLAYVAAVEQAVQPEGRLPPNCRPSLLQTKLKNGQNRLVKLLEPTIEPGSQGFVDLAYNGQGALQPETSRVWSFGLSLVQADGVGKTGLQRVRAPCLYIARIALFDRRANRFLGNVLGVRPESVGNYDKRWVFNPDERIIVRCGCVQSDPQAGTRLVTDDALSLYMEFNVSYRLTVEDTVNMPQSEQRCSQLLDEINTCWAMVSFKKCAQLQREVAISVPLHYGSIYDPQDMDAFYAEKRSKTPFRSAFKGRENPVLQFRVGPLAAGKPPLVPYAYMPPTLLGTYDLATALGAYRMSLALLLGRQAGPFAAAADPVLAGFPPLLADHHLLAEFLTRWRDISTKMLALLDTGCCGPEVMPPLPALVEAFRRCVIELAPLAHCPTIPARHINNFVEYQGHRLRMVQRYCHVMDPGSNKILGARHPVEPLSHAGFEFLFTPFDVSEVRVCMADRLEHPEPFYKRT
ncbi:hypothetical protein HXX76_015641 [Chlamydomonas incerta]|uniref:Uncharacterized protein n=1 Tax=Chlamydomonas incerta TaxID=51695 RepID=A0A835SLR5_CHLIN|nr:hypothetical protein HXX76_015641 [Chlamydomonas incerta]|eukprot:KAG2422970.1 hypothetical protein HXX76_015641 [Chlamydomonas incerta]